MKTLKINTKIDSIKKPRCHNCKFAGQQFKIGKLTHLHCASIEMEKYYKEDPCPSGWHSLRVFNDTCDIHEFKTNPK